MKPIISVKEARKLLGKDYRSLTDEEILKIIDDTHQLAILALDVAKDKIAKEGKLSLHTGDI